MLLFIYRNIKPNPDETLSIIKVRPGLFVLKNVHGKLLEQI